MEEASHSTVSAQPMIVARALSRCATKLRLCRLNEVDAITAESSCTGFFWLHADRLYIITNWHCVTGIDPIQSRTISDKAFTPTTLEVVVSLDKTPDAPTMLRDVRTARIPLYDENGNPNWLVHRQYGHRVDVVALEIGILDAILFDQPINTYEGFVDFDVAVGDDAFVLGYPLGLGGGGRFPIWKRASIASEPYFDIDDLPKILVDTATRAGMSGAPVIACRRGIANPRGKTGLNSDTIIGEALVFLGVYSGRIDADTLGAQIGIVWKGRVVGEIVEGGVRGPRLFG
jgi:hypothetical protein